MKILGYTKRPTKEAFEVIKKEINKQYEGSREEFDETEYILYIEVDSQKYLVVIIGSQDPDACYGGSQYLYTELIPVDSFEPQMVPIKATTYDIEIKELEGGEINIEKELFEFYDSRCCYYPYASFHINHLLKLSG